MRSDQQQGSDAGLRTAAAFSSLIPDRVPEGRPRRVLLRLFGLDQLIHLYDQLRVGDPDRPLADRLLTRLKVRYRVSECDRERIPKSGPLLVVANHPFGFLEPAILFSLLHSVRHDVKFLANDLLTSVPEIREDLISVNPFGGAAATRQNRRGLRQALEWLRMGKVLVVFPSGEVSHFQWRDRKVLDREWDPTVSGMVRLTQCGVLPVYVDGANSLLFQAAGMIHSGLRTALLPRELLNKRSRRVTVRVGSPIPAGKLSSLENDRECAQYLRWRTYLLKERSEFKPRTALPFIPKALRRDAEVPIAASPSAADLQADVDRLAPQRCLLVSGPLACYIAPSSELPAILPEIGRLREVSFRKVGEGTGRERDLDTFDDHYLQLFLWHATRREVVGAYRLARTDEVNARLGRHGLYTQTLFEYPQELLDRMGPALELGRSFVRPEYQVSRTPLMLIWKGIGKYVVLNPQYRCLFGPVSISNRYQMISKQLMVRFLGRSAWLQEWAEWVKARNPFPVERIDQGAYRSGLDLDDLCSLVTDLDDAQPGVPVLLRHYLRLGGQLLGFNVDTEFSNAIDGLIVVDLTRTDPAILRRYMGRQEAEAFLRHHKIR